MAVIMAVAGATHMKSYSSKFMETKWVRRRTRLSSPILTPSPTLAKKFPVYISTDPSHIKPDDVKSLFKSCNHSCYRFPTVDSFGRVLEPDDVVDVDRLRIALRHSAVLVSVFCNSEDVVEIDASKLSREGDGGKEKTGLGNLGQLLRRVSGPAVTPSDGRFVGFGRAVCDYGLTASIYDVVVDPLLQGMGIGTMIVKKIISVLTKRDVYDISALCSEKERFFFKACGFRDNDILGSTTMMYTRTGPSSADGDQMVKQFGRKLLVVPPLRKIAVSSKSAET